MKKYLFFVFVLILMFSSCLSTPTKLTEKKIGNNKMYLVGRIDPGVDLEKFFKGDKPNELWVDMIFANQPPVNGEGKGLFFEGYKNADEYFIIELPKEEQLFFRRISYTPYVSVFKQTSLDLTFDIKLEYNSSDIVIYLGDLIFSHTKEKSTLEVKDNYEEMKKVFSNYFINKDGKCIIPEKRLITPPAKVDAGKTIKSSYLFWN
jgi:hypothetical protein